MLTFQFTFAIVLLAAVFLISKRHAHPVIARQHELRDSCTGCGNKCDLCKYGITKSPCETHTVWECLRGPNETCGSRQDWGKCAGGLDCRCGRCIGCIISLNGLYECYGDDDPYRDPCLPHEGLDLYNYLYGK